MCVKKEANAPGDEECDAGEVYFSSYGECRLVSCLHGRNSLGFCHPAPVVTVPPVPSKPAGVEANGDSRGLTGNKGQAVVKWKPVLRAASYNIRYRIVVCVTPGCAEWRNGPSVTGTTATISNLETDDLYHIQVQAVHVSGGGKSSWSDTVYAYPTRVPATKGDTVGILPIKGYIQPTTYTYRICTHTLAGMTLSDRNDWIAEVVEGIDFWEEATGMVNAVHDTNLICPSDIRRAPPERRSSANLAVNTVEQVNGTTMNKRCEREDINDPPASGCADPSYSGDRLSSTEISILDGLGNTRRYARGSTAKQCTQLNQTAMHEAGHAFGLRHPSEEPNDIPDNSKSVMNYRHSTCSPEEYDIVAIKGIYQSRSALNSGTTTTAATTTTTATTASATTTTAATTTTTTTVTPTTTTSTTTTTTATPTATTTTASQPVTLWQIEARPTIYTTNDIEWHFTSGNTFTYAGRTYTIDRIKTHRRGARIQATPDLEDHELPDRTQIRFWPTDTPASVQTLRLGDAIVMPAGNRWDLIWGRRRYPIDIDRNTTWHIDLTIPAGSGS